MNFLCRENSVDVRSRELSLRKISKRHLFCAASSFLLMRTFSSTKLSLLFCGEILLRESSRRLGELLKEM
jgi:hypothetical protein